MTNQKSLDYKNTAVEYYLVVGFGGFPDFENKEIRWKLFCYQKC